MVETLLLSSCVSVTLKFFFKKKIYVVICVICQKNHAEKKTGRTMCQGGIVPMSMYPMYNVHVIRDMGCC